MKQILILITIFQLHVYAVSYNRDIQPMIDFKKAQQDDNAALYEEIRRLKERVEALEALIKKTQK